MSAKATRYVAVVGAASATPDEESTAAEVGRLLAGAGAIVVTGGLGGVMAAACRRARDAAEAVRLVLERL